MTPRLSVATLVFLAGAFAGTAASDPYESDDRALLEWLKAVQPETGHVMIEVGDRYQNRYFAARQGNWTFAAYQVEEIEEAMERLAILKPEHKTGSRTSSRPV
jgi:hypothetical protein